MGATCLKKKQLYLSEIQIEVDILHVFMFVKSGSSKTHSFPGVCG